jgi:hypothetical protein
MKSKTLGLLAVGLLAGPIPARAVTIDWVDFSSYTSGSASQAPFTSSDGLSLAVSFSDLTNFAAAYPGPAEAVVSDPLWPFENSSVSSLIAFGDVAPISTTLTFAFDNEGGLPVGGSVAIADLEEINSSVAIVGLVDGVPVPVSWSLAFYSVAGDNSTPPIWDPSTNTLFGAGGLTFPTLNSFAFFTSDTELDELQFIIRGAGGDGIGFAVSADTVPPRAVPESGTLGLIGLGLLGLGLARLRRSG